MKDLYYRFKDEQEMFDYLLMADMAFVDNEENIIAMSGNHQYASWVVGTIEGIDGYHYNLRLIDEDFGVSLLEPFIVVPVNPKCVWA
jgi:hypothetical protein